MKESRTVRRPAVVECPRHLPLVDLLVDARSELFELAVRSGLKVLETMLEEDRTLLCGPRYAHMAERRASRAGTVSSGSCWAAGRSPCAGRGCAPAARR
jgi:hypothetical protein